MRVGFRDRRPQCARARSPSKKVQTSFFLVLGLQGFRWQKFTPGSFPDTRRCLSEGVRVAEELSWKRDRRRCFIGASQPRPPVGRNQSLLNVVSRLAASWEREVRRNLEA